MENGASPAINDEHIGVARLWEVGHVEKDVLYLSVDAGDAVQRGLIRVHG